MHAAVREPDVADRRAVGEAGIGEGAFTGFARQILERAVGEASEKAGADHHAEKEDRADLQGLGQGNAEAGGDGQPV